jgi:Arc/MetJ-type ribon-helix-helix transcriptional regulator
MESWEVTAMTIEIRKPELEQMLQEEILRGHFQNVDDLLTEALQALREKNSQPTTISAPPRKNLAQFLLESPFAGSDLHLERQQDYGGGCLRSGAG